MEQRTWLNHNILWLSYASMLCDMGTEILKALLPALVISAGGGAALLATIESGATVTLALTPLIVGWLSDYLHQRKWFVSLGYFFNSAGLMLIYVFPSAGAIVVGKLLTSLGKGTRHATKEALIGESVDERDAGKAFGFNSALDSLGALVGPFAAIGLLWVMNVHTLFVYALFFPLLSALIVLFMVNEPRHTTLKRPTFSYSLTHLPAEFKQFLLCFVCFNISAIMPSFLLLHAYQALSQPLTHSGLTIESTSTLLILYSVYNLTLTAFSFIAGYFMDRLGAKTVLTFGYGLNILVLLGFALWTPTLVTLAWLFALMGMRVGLTDGVEKAHADTLLPEKLKGSGFGIVEFWQSSAQIISAILFGLLWSYGSAAIAFATFAAISGISLILVLHENE